MANDACIKICVGTIMGGDGFYPAVTIGFAPDTHNTALYEQFLKEFACLFRVCESVLSTPSEGGFFVFQTCCFETREEATIFGESRAVPSSEALLHSVMGGLPDTSFHVSADGDEG